MTETVGVLTLQRQDRPEGAEAEYRRFLEVQRRSDPLTGAEVRTLTPPGGRPTAQKEPT